MKEINGKMYYRMSELYDLTGINKSTIQYYKELGLIPEPFNTSKNMGYYPIVTKNVLNLIKYLTNDMGYSINHIVEVFKEYNISFNIKSEILLNIIELITFDKKNGYIRIEKNKVLNKLIELNLLENKESYSEKEYERYKIFKEIFKYEEGIQLIESYIIQSKTMAKLEKLLADKVFEKEKELPEILVLDILNKFKPFIFNKSLLNEYKKGL